MKLNPSLITLIIFRTKMFLNAYRSGSSDSRGNMIAKGKKAITSFRNEPLIK